MPTGISWCDEVLNVISGCSHASPGCLHCYAERMSFRQAHMEIERGVTGDKRHYATGVVFMSGKDKGSWTGKLHFNQDALLKVDGYKKPRSIFVNSMSDTFNKNAEWNWQYKIFEIMLLYPRHTFFILTKRPEIMRNNLDSIYFHLKRNYPDAAFPLPNVRLGVTVESQEYIWRIDILLDIPAAGRFVSVEPMIDAVDFSKLPPLDDMYCSACRTFFDSPEEGVSPCCEADLVSGSYNEETNLVTCSACKEEFNDDDTVPVCPNCDDRETCGDCPGPAHSDVFTERVWERDLPVLRKLDHVIVGCESGPNARPMKKEWAESVIQQCESAGVPVTLKQMFVDGKMVKEPFLDGKQYLEVPK